MKAINGALTLEVQWGMGVTSFHNPNKSTDAESGGQPNPARTARKGST